MKNPFTFFVIIFSLTYTILPQITFDANFESGNLNTVTTNDSVNFTVTTRTDIGGRWFYFRMSGVQGKFIKVTVSNSDVKRAVYSYDNNSFERFSEAESPLINVFQKTYTQDTVFVAYYIPYTFSFLQKRISEWKISPYVEIDTLVKTLRNFPIQEIRITDTTIPDSQKEHIWIHARTHPGETPSSWHFDGLVEKLLEEDEVIAYYRRKLIFHCIPFTNPDGVFYGKSRTNFDGIDIEANWNLPDAQTSKEVQILKARMIEINSLKPMKIFLNLHSQAASYCTFWIHTSASTSDYFYRKEMQFANLQTSDNPFFKQSDYSFSSLQSKFPEGWLWGIQGEKVMALTYETPYDFYSNRTIVTNENLAYLGERTVFANAEYLEISHPKRILLDNSSIASTWFVDSSGQQFYGKNYYYTPGNNNSGNIVFATGMLEKGSYDIYAWWPANTGFAYDASCSIEGGSTTLRKILNFRSNGGMWNYIGTKNLNKSGEITITVSDSATGIIVADAFRIIYRGESTGVDESESTEKTFELYQNYPNPFNPETTISYHLVKPGLVRLQILNIIGETIKTLVQANQSAGFYEYHFDGSELASGTYIVALSVNGERQALKCILLK